MRSCDGIGWQARAPAPQKHGILRGIVFLLAGLPLFGQDTPVFNAEARLSTVHFHVVQGKSYVGNLKPEDFVLLEDGAPRGITLFESAPNERRRWK